MVSTSVAVGCAVGIPSFVALCVAFIFYVKTKRRFQREDQEFIKNSDIENMNHDLSYDKIDELKINEEKKPSVFPSSEPSEVSGSGSEDGRPHSGKKQPNDFIELEDNNEKNAQTDQKKQPRYVPAYKKKLRSQANLNINSRSSSFSNLNNLAGGASNSSINSGNTTTTDNFYGNVPVLDDNAGNISARTSSDLAKSLQQPTPSYSRRPSSNHSKDLRVRSPSISTSQILTDDDLESAKEYDLKNNYNHANEHEIQEEDQYENEFTNYSENKRAYIESLRPKAN